MSYRSIAPNIRLPSNTADHPSGHNILRRLSARHLLLDNLPESLSVGQTSNDSDSLLAKLLASHSSQDDSRESSLAKLFASHGRQDDSRESLLAKLSASHGKRDDNRESSPARLSVGHDRQDDRQQSSLEFGSLPDDIFEGFTDGDSLPRKEDYFCSSSSQYTPKPRLQSIPQYHCLCDGLAPSLALSLCFLLHKFVLTSYLSNCQQTPSL